MHRQRRGWVFHSRFIEGTDDDERVHFKAAYIRQAGFIGLGVLQHQQYVLDRRAVGVVRTLRLLPEYDVRL